MTRRSMDTHTPTVLHVVDGCDEERRRAAAVLALPLRRLLADVVALWLKTKNFHWHVRGPHFRDHHLLLDEQAAQLFAIVDVAAERLRTMGAPAVRSIGDVAAHQRIRDNDEASPPPLVMLRELRDDSLSLARSMHELHALCDEHGDVATASLLETWIDETERRAWFLAETLAG